MIAAAAVGAMDRPIKTADDGNNPHAAYRRQDSSSNINPNNNNPNNKGNTAGNTSNSTHGNVRRSDPLLPPLILDAHILSSSSIDPNPSAIEPSQSSVVSVGKYLSTQITCICNVTVPRRESGARKNSHSVLMGGCSDGSIIHLGYRRAKLIDVPYRPERRVTTMGEGKDEGNRIGTTGTGGGIRLLVHRTDGVDGRTMGRLVAIYTDGTARIFSTEFGVGGPSKLLGNDHRRASLDGGGSGECGLQMASVSVSTSASVDCDVEYDGVDRRGIGDGGGGATEDDAVSAVVDINGSTTDTAGKQRRDGERKPLLQKEDDVNPPSLLPNGDHSTELTNIILYINTSIRYD